MPEQPSQHQRWLDQYRSDELTLKAQALQLLRQLLVASEIGTGARALDAAAPQIRTLIGQHELLIAQLVDPSQRIVREPAHLPSQEAA